MAIISNFPQGGKIDAIKVNNTEQEIVNRSVNITVPTMASDIGADPAGSAAAVQVNLDAVTAKIPYGATSTNQLVTASQMGDAIEAVEAKQLYATSSQGSFATKAALTGASTFYNADGTVATPTKNDVAYVLADESHSGKAAKYVIASTNPIVWGFVITFSDVTFTQTQMNAINSGATSEKIAGYDSHIGNNGIHVTSTDKTNWNNKGTYSKPSTGIPKTDLASAVQTSLGKADSAIPSSEKGANNGVATLGTNGIVPSSQLPTIPSEVTESTVSGWGFTKNSGTITGVNVDGTSVATSGTASIDTPIGYYTCSTAAGTVAKVGTYVRGAKYTSSNLPTGAMALVKFTNANSASNPTLNLNSSGAKALKQYGTTAISTAAATSGWQAGAVCLFVYDGTNWVRNQGYNTNTTYSSQEAAEGGTATSLVTTGEKYIWNNKSNFSGSYNDLTNKPTIPTVNNGKLTMQVNGTQKATFTANQSGASTFNVTAADLGLTNSMIFVGVSTTDPSTSGATVSGHSTWKKGEVVLYNKKEFVLTGDTNEAANWTELGDESSFALKNVTITGDGVLEGGGTLEANRTITHKTSGVTAGSYGDSGNQTPAYGGTFKVPYVTVNDTGHVTGISAHTVKIPASDNTNQTVKGNGTAFSANDAVDIVAGSNVTVTADTTNKKITIAATDTKALDSMTGTLGVSHGGTGATDAATARTNLGITPANIGAAPTVHNHTSGTTVAGSGNAVLNINGLSATTDYAYLDVNGGSNNARPLVLQSGNKSTGNVGIGVTQPTDKLEVDGNINATGTIKQNGTAVSLSGHTHTKSDITNLGTIGAAAAKSVDTSIAASSTSTNLPTSGAVASFVEGKGYTTNTGTVTTTGTMTASHVVTSNGGTVIKDSGFTIAKSVPSDAVFTDNNQTVKGNGTAFGANDAIDIVAGSNVTVTADTTNKKITIAATDTNTHNSHAIISGLKADGTTNIQGTASSGNITMGDSGVTAGEYGPTANQTPAYGATFNVPDIKVNAKGIVTSATNRTVKIPASDNTDTKVTQSLSTANGDYPVILKNSTTATDSPTSTTNYAAAVKVNPSTGNLTVTKINGVAVGTSPKFTDTTYSSKSAASGGSDVSLVTTGEKYTWNNKGTYSKPSGGIPKTDLASAVQTSLGKADGAEQSTNKVTTISSASTDSQYPSAKCVYDLIGNIEAALAAI